MSKYKSTDFHDYGKFKTMGIYDKDVLVCTVTMYKDLPLPFKCRLYHHLGYTFVFATMHLDQVEALVEAHYQLIDEHGYAYIRLADTIVKANFYKEHWKKQETHNVHQQPW